MVSRYDFPADTDTQRFCSKNGGHWAGLTDFRVDPRSPVGTRHRRCEPCRAKATAESRKASPNKKRIERNNLLVTRYGITLERYEQMVAEQDGVCAIPGCDVDITVLDERGCSAPVDHCHRSGRVRKVLCWSCNSGLGMFRDSIEKLRGAADYLVEHGDDTLSLVA